MKHSFTFFIGFWLAIASAFAQEKTIKVYVADVSGTNASLTNQQLKRRNDEIKFQARTKVSTDLLDLLNTLTSTDPTVSEREQLIKNSFLPNENQVFFGDDAVVEDDIDPSHTSSANAVETTVETYLRNVDLFYNKSDSLATISFSRFVVSDVQEGKNYLYIKVFYTQSFGSKHKQIDSPYQTVQRVAELRVENVDNKWRTFITRLSFLQPGDVLSQLTKPVITNESGPGKPLKSEVINFRRTDNPSDSVSLKFDAKWLNIVRSSIDMVPVGFYQRTGTISLSQSKVNVSLSDLDQQLTFRRIDGSTIQFASIYRQVRLKENSRRYQVRGWAQIAVGILSLGVSYAGYSSLQNSYKQYTGKVAAANADFAIWQALNQPPDTGSPVAAIAFNSYASPGVYAVYGGGLIGSGLIFNGIRQLLKAHKVKSESKK